MEDIRIQDFIEIAPTTSVSEGGRLSYHHDCHEHLTVGSSLSSISCCISNSTSSRSSSSRSSRPTTPGDVATACRSHLPGVDFSAFGSSDNGRSGGSSSYSKTEPPSSDTCSCYGFPNEYVSPGFAFAATVEASEGNSPASPTHRGCITSEASDGGCKDLRCSPGNGVFSADSSRSRRTTPKAEATSKGYCCDRALSSWSSWENSAMEVRRVGTDGIGGMCCARSSAATFASVPYRRRREGLDGDGDDGDSATGGICKATTRDRPPHQLRPLPSSQEEVSSAATSTPSAAAASAVPCRATTGDQGGYRSAADHGDLEDDRNHANDHKRIDDAGGLEREARFSVTMRVPRHGGVDNSAEYPEVSTAKRARLTPSHGGDCEGGNLWDGNEKSGGAGATKQRGREKDNRNAEGSEIPGKKHGKSDKCSHTLPFDGMDDGSFPILSTPPMSRTARKKPWTSSTTCRARGGAAGGNAAARSGRPTDMMSDMMKSFGDIQISSHSELPSGTSRGRVLLRTRAMRAIQSFPDVVTCFRDGGSMHTEGEDRKLRGGRSVSDSVMPMDQVCSVGPRKEGTGDTGSGQIRGTGHRGINGQDHHIEHVSKGGIGITDGSSRAGFGCEYVGMSGGDSTDSTFVEVEAAALEGPSHEYGEIVVEGREFGRWTRSNSGSSTCSTSSPHSSIDVVEVWKEKGGRRAPRPVTQAATSDSTRQSQKHRLNCTELGAFEVNTQDESIVMSQSCRCMASG